MAELPESDWISLGEAGKQAIAAYPASPQENVAKGLVRAFFEGHVSTRGRCKALNRHDMLVEIGQRVWDPNQVRIDWDSDCFESTLEGYSYVVIDVEVGRREFEKWCCPSPLRQRVPNRAKVAIKRQRAEREFAKPDWSFWRVVSWIAYRDPIEICRLESRRAVMWPRLHDLVRAGMQDPVPEQTVLTAVNSGVLVAIVDGRLTTKTDWFGKEPWSLANAYFRRKDVQAIWPHNDLELDGAEGFRSASAIEVYLGSETYWTLAEAVVWALTRDASRVSAIPRPSDRDGLPADAGLMAELLKLIEKTPETALPPQVVHPDCEIAPNNDPAPEVSQRVDLVGKHAN